MIFQAMIKAIIFDWDGVFTTNFYDRIFTVCPSIKKLDEIESRYSDSNDCSGFFREIRKEFNIEFTDEEITELFNSENMTGLLGYLPVLKKKYKLYLLSNQMKIRTDYIRKNFDLRVFDDVFFSNEIGLIKPDREIFDFVLKQIRLNADECLFIDDTQKNLDTAKTIGINAVKYLELNQLRTELLTSSIEL
jgi:putative hydrolase of the HAD superfamily